MTTLTLQQFHSIEIDLDLYFKNEDLIDTLWMLAPFKYHSLGRANDNRAVWLIPYEVDQTRVKLHYNEILSLLK